MATETAVLLSLVGALAGSMVFFALIVAPKVFQALPAEHAGIFLRAFFPSYYLWGLLFATASAIVAAWSGAVFSLICATIAALFAYARQILMPKINAARDAQMRRENGARKRFNRLHLQSVVINGLQLLMLLAVGAALFWQPTPS